MLIHNFCRYLYPMRIDKPLIVIFYVGVAVKVSAMIAAIIYINVVKGSNYDPYSPVWWMTLVNYLAENIVGVVFIMQWLHLAYSI